MTSRLSPRWISSDDGLPGSGEGNRSIKTLLRVCLGLGIGDPRVCRGSSLCHCHSPEKSRSSRCGHRPQSLGKAEPPCHFANENDSDILLSLSNATTIPAREEECRERTRRLAVLAAQTVSATSSRDAKRPRSTAAARTCPARALSRSTPAPSGTRGRNFFDRQGKGACSSHRLPKPSEPAASRHSCDRRGGCRPKGNPPHSCDRREGCRLTSFQGNPASRAGGMPANKKPEAPGTQGRTARFRLQG